MNDLDKWLLDFSLKHFSIEGRDLVWKVDKRCAKKGSLVGAVQKHRRTAYRYTCLHTPEGVRKFAVHRIVFLMSFGDLPDVIDHIDCNGLNNSPGNLRASSTKDNAMNRRGANLNNKHSKVRGVHYRKDNGKYRVRIAGKNYGQYDTLEEAVNRASDILKA